MSKLGLGSYCTINSFVKGKVNSLMAGEYTFRRIFEVMHQEPDNVFLEDTDGYHIYSVSYRQFHDRCIQAAGFVKDQFASLCPGSLLGIYMDNSELFLELFWGVLMAGFRPVLMNTRLPIDQLENVISTYHLSGVFSNHKLFPVVTILSDDIDLSKYEISLSAFSDSWADEILLMTSGTSSNVKLCSYSGENFVYQILDSSRILRHCQRVKEHYHGRLKLLTFLPFYHIFGLTAVFMWFGFFSRTFVLLRDFSPDTIVNTVKKLEVTHIFSVPLLFETIFKKTISTVRAMNDGSFEKLEKGILLYEKLSKVPFIAHGFSHFAFRKVRREIFGESIRFLITGGSAVAPDVLRFFNAIGYHLANGYGMTEIGITSFELSSSFHHLTDGSIGLPFHSVSYCISSDGILEVRGKTLANHVYLDGNEIGKDEEGWFSTGDCAEYKNGRYYILGRSDDVIIGNDGENLNPDMMESSIHIDGAKTICIVKDSISGSGALLVQVSSVADQKELDAIKQAAVEELNRLNLRSLIRRIILTPDALMQPFEFKTNRRVLSQKLASNEFRHASMDSSQERMEAIGVQIADIIAKALEKEWNAIGPDSDFFLELGGSSLEYFAVITAIRKEFGVEMPVENGKMLSTVRTMADYIRKNGSDL